jgi:hypothetical protein
MDLFVWGIAFGTASVLIFIFYSVLTNNKAIGALIQLGDVQRRQEVHDEIATTKKTTDQTQQPKLSTLTERISFTIGVLNACLTCYIIGSHPTKFYIWYTPKALILTFARWNDFRKRKQHYLLYDFCYWANGLTLYYLWFDPTNAHLFQIVFFCANGPLAWSILAFNQSLVFHKWQQIVSVFIHISPTMLTFGLRWYHDPQFHICDDFPDCTDTSAYTMILRTLTHFYLWWIVVYYLWVFVFLGPYLQSRSFTTLYDRVAGTQMKFLFSDTGALRDHHHLFKKAVYMCTHVVFGVFTMVVAAMWWWFWWAHLLFILTIATLSAYNASAHYNDQFRVEVEARK